MSMDIGSKEAIKLTVCESFKDSFESNMSKVGDNYTMNDLADWVLTEPMIDIRQITFFFLQMQHGGGYSNQTRNEAILNFLQEKADLHGIPFHSEVYFNHVNGEAALNSEMSKLIFNFGGKGVNIKTELLDLIRVEFI